MADPYGYDDYGYNHGPAGCTQIACDNEAVFEVKQAKAFAGGVAGKFVARARGTKNNGKQLCEEHAKAWFEGMLQRGVSKR